MKAVILEVLAVVGWVEVEIIVGNESGRAQPSFSSVSSCHSTDDSGICCLTEVNGVSMVVRVLELITELDDNTTSEWPFEVVIKLSSNQVGKS